MATRFLLEFATDTEYRQLFWHALVYLIIFFAVGFNPGSSYVLAHSFPNDLICGFLLKYHTPSLPNQLPYNFESHNKAWPVPYIFLENHCANSSHRVTVTWRPTPTFDLSPEPKFHNHTTKYCHPRGFQPACSIAFRSSN